MLQNIVIFFSRPTRPEERSTVMNSTNDPCQQYRIAIQNLNDRLAALQEALAQEEADGVNTGPTQQEIRRVEEELRVESILLQQCIANAHPVSNLTIIGTWYLNANYLGGSNNFLLTATITGGPAPGVYQGTLINE